GLTQGFAQKLAGCLIYETAGRNGAHFSKRRRRNYASLRNVRISRHCANADARFRGSARTCPFAMLSAKASTGEDTMLTFARILALAAALAAAPALAHTPNQPPHQSYKIGDFTLESGEVIKDFAISYVTHGKLNEKKSNAILMVTAISGNHHRIDFMIGPGKALDTDKYFIVCTDAIANGLTTSPSNSKAQPRMQFPKFTIRDMVASQYRLMKEKLGIDHVVAVVGPSMGGMQVLQWGVSHPDYMDALVAMVPLAKTPAWSIAVMESSRKAIMLDPAWKDGNYDAPPEKGIRLWRDILTFLSARTPDMYAAQFKNGLDILPWLEQQETALLK